MLSDAVRIFLGFLSDRKSLMLRRFIPDRFGENSEKVVRLPC